MQTLERATRASGYQLLRLAETRLGRSFSAFTQRHTFSRVTHRSHAQFSCKEVKGANSYRLVKHEHVYRAKSADHCKAGLVGRDGLGQVKPGPSLCQGPVLRLPGDSGASDVLSAQGCIGPAWQGSCCPLHCCTHAQEAPCCFAVCRHPQLEQLS